MSAVNSYLENEREQLSKRAIVLSGVSHDLGTPATRLRLRAALIKERDLCEKLEADIDSMTEMIESVLTYTRAAGTSPYWIWTDGMSHPEQREGAVRVGNADLL